VTSMLACLSAWLSVCLLAYVENHMAELHQFLCTLPVAVVRSSSYMLCTSGFVDDVMFAHNGLYGGASCIHVNFVYS